MTKKLFKWYNINNNNKYDTVDNTTITILHDINNNDNIT